MENKLSVLIIDDERHFTEELEEFFTTCGFIAYSANSGEEGLALLGQRQIDLLVLDVRLPGMNGLEILKFVRENHPSAEVIVVSAHGDMDTVISALRLGAIDYLRKPFRQMDIRIAIERTQKFLLLQQRLKLAEERSSLISNALAEKIERHMIGKSSGMRQVMEMALTAAGFHDTNVLITGESGTGKENVARIIHFASQRRDQLMYTVNSSSVSESLMESEFFGYKKGAFTGASADKKGFFEICHGGTLFLDEIADMPLSLQAKVLRAIEEKRITRVGDTEPIYTDFRLITATNHDLDSLVRERKFRLDLLHRLNTLHIHIPPLRERTEDIEPLMLHFAEDFSKKINKASPVIKPEVFASLPDYSFPGNVRELKNMVERAVILSRTGILDLADFPFKHEPVENQNHISNPGTLNENEARLIREALQRNGYNQQATAKELGVSRDALIRKMTKYNIVLRKKEI